MGAEWTLTRVDILSLRLAAPKPSLQIRLRVKSLGCQRCYRGCRAGRLVGRRKHEQKMKMQLTHFEIPIIIGRCSKQGRRHEPRESVLRHIDAQAAAVVTVSQSTSTRNMVPPALYVLNAAAITKPHAIDHLAADMRGYHVDVGIITETHFKKSHASHAFKVDGYSLYRRDRSKRRGGGVAIYVSSHLHSSVWLPDNDQSDFEMLWVRVQSDEHNVIICAIYHPPKPIYQTTDLLRHIDSCLETISRDLPSALVVLAGDFNSLSDSDVVSRTAWAHISSQ